MLHADSCALERLLIGGITWRRIDSAEYRYIIMTCAAYGQSQHVETFHRLYREHFPDIYAMLYNPALGTNHDLDALRKFLACD